MSGLRRLQSAFSPRPVDPNDPPALEYFLNRVLTPFVRALGDFANRIAGDAIATSSSITLTGGEGLVKVDASLAPLAIVLPPPTALFHLLIVQKVDASLNPVTVAAPGLLTINGVPNLTLTTQWERLLIVADDTSYYA